MRPHLVAQYAYDKNVSVLIWSSVLIVVVILGFIAISVAKRRLRDDGDAANIKPLGFTLADLRQLHRTGQMSDAEFNRAKEKIVGAARKTPDGKKTGR